MRPGYGGEVTTPSYGPPSRSVRASPWTTSAVRRGARTRANALTRVSVSRLYLPEALRRGRHRTARPAMLVAPVRPQLRRAREVEVEVGRPPGGSRRPREDHPQDVDMLVLGDQGSKDQQLARRRG